MKIEMKTRGIKCDGVHCSNISNAEIDLESYKGILFLCNDCLKKFQSLLRRNSQKNEQG